LGTTQLRHRRNDLPSFAFDHIHVGACTAAEFLRMMAPSATDRKAFDHRRTDSMTDIGYHCTAGGRNYCHCRKTGHRRSTCHVRNLVEKRNGYNHMVDIAFQRRGQSWCRSRGALFHDTGQGTATPGESSST